MQKRNPHGTAASERATRPQPDSLDCTVYRRREPHPTSPAGPAPRLSGIPTPEDESSFEYRKLGDGRMSLIDSPVVPADRHDPTPRPTRLETRIAALADAGQDGHFVPGIQDVVIAFRGTGVALAYEIVQTVNTVDDGSQPMRYLVLPRDDLGYIEPFDEAPALAPPDPPAASDEPDLR